MRPSASLHVARLPGLALLLGLAVARGPEASLAQEAPAPQATPASTPFTLSIPDVPVLTQEGRPVRFHRDLVAGKVVAVNFIFTTCRTICPPLGVNFGKLQGLLGERFDKDAFLISVSVDPVNDTPARLKAWAAKFGVRPGWTLVTGRKPDMDRLLKALNAFTARPEEHTPMILIGNDARGTWTRAYGLAPAATLLRSLEEAMAGAAEHSREPQQP